MREHLLESYVYVREDTAPGIGEFRWEEHKCADCGAVWKTTNRRAVRCSVCRQKRNKAYDRKRSARVSARRKAHDAAA